MIYWLRPGDCLEYDDIDYLCRRIDDTCNLYTYGSTLSDCGNKRADYYHVRYRCVPAYSSTIRSYDVCDRVFNILTDSSAFIKSPNYPIYTMVPTACTTQIIAVNSFKIIFIVMCFNFEYFF